MPVIAVTQQWGKQMTEREILLDLLKKDFKFFVAFTCKEFDNYNYKFHNWHNEMADLLLSMKDGDKWVINAPPRLGKTVLVQKFIAWEILKDPKASFIYISYEERLAMSKAREVRSLVKQLAKYFDLEDISISREKGDSSNEWHTMVGGGCLARGSGNGVTGYGANHSIIIDDPNKPEDRLSTKILEDRNTMFRSKIRNRINQTGRQRILVIQQRVASNDLSGFLLNGGMQEEWKHFNYPAYDDNGVELCPEMLPYSEVQKYASDPFTLNAQYLQKPMDLIGELFTDKDLVLDPVRPNWREMVGVISIDASGKGKIDSDCNAIAVCFTDFVNYYVVELLNFKSDITRLLDATRGLREKYGDKVPVLFESKANGMACVQLLRQEMTGVLEANPYTSKIDRAKGIRYLLDGGNVKWCVYGPIWEACRKQFKAFPHTPHDDMVDAVVQGLTWLSKLDPRRYRKTEPRQGRVHYGAAPSNRNGRRKFSIFEGA